MQMPSNTWTRWRWPSITLKCTRRVSPALNSGSSRSWRCSMSWMTVMAGRRAGSGRMLLDRGEGSQMGAGPVPRLLLTPARDLRVIPGEEDGRHGPAAEGLRAGVVGVLEPPAQRLRERLLVVACVAP